MITQYGEQPWQFRLKKEPYLIAEAGLNHNGNVRQAHLMIDAAGWAGVDAIKFQTYNTDEFCPPESPLYWEFKRSELPAYEWVNLAHHAADRGLDFLSTPQNLRDLELLLPLGIKSIKVGSDDFTNYELLNRYATHGLPLILSCGMSTEAEIVSVLTQLHSRPVMLMVCTSLYPCPQDKANLGRIERLRKLYPSLTVGFSDHTQSLHAKIMAYGLGARIFETHFTLDTTLPGPDHGWSHNPDSLRMWAADLNYAHELYGSGKFELSDEELEAKRKYQRASGQQLRRG